MKKRNVFGLFLAMLLAVTMVVTMLPMGALAASVAEPADDAAPAEADDVAADAEPAAADEAIPEAEPVADPADDDVFAVYDAEGALVGYYKNPTDADKAVKDGYTLKMLKDYTATATYTWRQGAIDTKWKSAGWSAVNTTEAGMPITWTFDGDGHTWTANLASNSFAWLFDAKSHADKINIKNVTIISTYAGIQFQPNSGAGLEADLTDVKVYAGNMYEVMVTKSVTEGNTGAALNNSTGNTLTNIYDTSESGVDNTLFYSWSSSALESYGLVSVHGGKWYAANADDTVRVTIGTAVTSGRGGSQKIYIYGGEFYGGKFCVARAMNGAQLYIFGGKFVNTQEYPNTGDLPGTAVIRCANGGQFGYVTILGGEFWLNDTTNATSAAVYAFAYGSATILGGTFYYPNDGRATGTAADARINTNAFTDVSEQEDLTAEPASVTAPSTLEDTRTLTFTAPYKQTYACKYATLSDYLAATTLEVDPAEDTADVAIYDKDGNLVTLIDLSEAIHAYATASSTAVSYYTSVADNIGYSTQIVPNGGKWQLLKDVSTTNLANFFAVMPGFEGEVDGGGHIITGALAKKYLAYSNVRTLDMHDITLTNNGTGTSGRVLEISDNVNFHNQVWNFTDVTLTAGSGSAIYMSYNGTLNLLDGTVFSLDETIAKENAESCALIQAFGNSVVNVYDGARLYHPGVRNASGVIVNISSIFAMNLMEVKLTQTNAVVWFRVNGAAVNVYGGELEVKMDQMHVVARTNNDAVSSFNVLGDATLTYNSKYDGTGDPVVVALNADPAVQVLDETGAEVALLDDMWKANAIVKDGYTVKLLKDLYTVEMAVFDKANINLTIDGNGKTAYFFCTGERSLDLIGSESNYTVKNLTVRSTSNGIYVGKDGTNTLKVHADLENVVIWGGALTEDNLANRWGNTYNVMIGGQLSSARIYGENTAIYSNNIACVTNKGNCEIYDGYFYAGATAPEALLTVSTTATASAVTDFGVCTVVYGGTFIGGTMSASRVYNGATLIIVDGNFVGGATGTSGVIRTSASNTSGYCYVLGGNFYATGTTVATLGNTGSVFGFGNDQYGMFMIYGGNYYSVADFGSTPMMAEANGTNIDRLYYSAGAVTGTSQRNRTAKFHFGAGYSQTTTAGLALAGADLDPDLKEIAGLTFASKCEIAKPAAVGDAVIRVHNAFSDTTVEYAANELILAALSIEGYGSTLTFLDDVTYDTPVLADMRPFPWGGGITIEGVAGEDTTVTYNAGNYSGFFLIVRGAGTVTLKNITFTAAAATDKGQGFLIRHQGTLVMDEGATLVATYHLGIYAMDGSTLILNKGAKVYAYDTTTTNTACPSIDGNAQNVASSYRSSSMIAAEAATVIMKGASIGWGPDGVAQTGRFAQVFALTADTNGYFYSGSVVSSFARCFYFQGGSNPGKGSLNFGNDPDGETLRMANHKYVPSATGTVAQGDDVIYVAGGYNGTTNFYDGVESYGRIHWGTPGANDKVNFYGGYYFTGDPAKASGGSDCPEKWGAWVTNTWGIFNVNKGAGATTVNFYGGTYEHATGSRLWKSEGSNFTVNVYGGDFSTSISDVFAVATAGYTKAETYNFYGAGTYNGVATDGCKLTVLEGGNACVYVDSTATGAAINIYGGDFTAQTHVISNAAGIAKITANVTGGTFHAAAKTPLFYMNGTGAGTAYNVSNAVFDVSLFNGPAVRGFTPGAGCTVITSKGAVTLGGTENFIAVGGAKDGTKYATVAAAIADGALSEDGVAIKQLADVALAASETLNTTGVKWTLDCDGYFTYILPFNTYAYLFNDTVGDGAEVTVKNFDALGGFANLTKVKLTAEGGTTDAQYDTYAFYMPGAATLTVEGTTFLASYSATGRGVYLTNANAVAVINDAYFQGAYAMAIAAAGGTLTVNDCTVDAAYGYMDGAGQDTTIDVCGGLCTINGGHFETFGMCCVRTLAGKTTAEKNGTISEVTTAKLVINGGEFVLLNGAGRDKMYVWDACVRCGGGSTYGTVVVNGGVFLNNRLGSNQVIFKNNTCATLNVNGGLFLATGEGVQMYFINTNGPSLDARSAADSMFGGDLAPVTIDKNASKLASAILLLDGETYYYYSNPEPEFNYAPSSETLAPEVLMGAQVRMSAAYTGLRFVTEIPAATLAELEGKGTVSFGTMIVPTDYLFFVDEFTLSAFEAAGIDVLDIAATENGIATDTEGNVTFGAAIINIRATNYTRAFSARAYIKVVDAAGVVTYYYGEYDEANNSRSIADVATLALNDVKDAADETYKYEITVDTATKYSRYTAEERTILASFIPAEPAPEPEPEVVPEP